MSKSDRKQAIAEHQAAKRRLEEVSKRDQSESEDYLAANAAMAATEKRVPWWRR
jgi:hypothetical protein